MKPVSHFYEIEKYKYNTWLEIIQTIVINRNLLQKTSFVWISYLNQCRLHGGVGIRLAHTKWKDKQCKQLFIQSSG